MHTGLTQVLIIHSTIRTSTHTVTRIHIHTYMHLSTRADTHRHKHVDMLACIPNYLANVREGVHLRATTGYGVVVRIHAHGPQPHNDTHSCNKDEVALHVVHRKRRLLSFDSIASASGADPFKLEPRQKKLTRALRLYNDKNVDGLPMYIGVHKA